jgi:hypothetical protein
MTNEKTMDMTKIFLLGMITAFLAVIAFRPADSSATAADGGGMGAAANGLIAVSAPKDGDLFIIDTSTKHVAHYNKDNADRFLMQGGRDFTNDLFIKDTDKKAGMSVKDAVKQAKEDMKD